MEVIVDRIENNLAVIEVAKGEMITYKIDNLTSIKEGDILEIDCDSEKISVNKKKTKQRKKQIKKLIDKVFLD